MGLASGLTGVGGGIFLTPPASDRRLDDRSRPWASAPFILANSPVAFLATRLAGQIVDGTPIFAIGSFAGAAVGTAIGLRGVSSRMIRIILTAILLASGVRMLAA